MGTKICKVCGEEYEYCKTQRPSELFRWEDVACCPTHAAEYFKRVEESRAKTEATDDKAEDDKAEIAVVYISNSECEDGIDEFEDEEDFIAEDEDSDIA